MNAIYNVRNLKVAGAQMFGLLKVEDLTFIPLKVRLLLFKDIIIFIFLSLLCDTVGESCWVIASIIVSVRRSSIKCCSYAFLS